MKKRNFLSDLTQKHTLNQMTHSEPSASPLLDIVMARAISSLGSGSPGYSGTNGRGLTIQQENDLRQAFSEFILKKIDYKTALSIIMPILNSPDLLVFTNTILTTPDTPLPNIDAKSSGADGANDADDGSAPGSLDGNGKNGTRKKTRSWTQAEDRRLIAGIHKFGVDNWANVAAFIGNGRTRAQCSQRWNRGLDPRISKDQWTKEEDEKLINLVRLKGTQGWTVIASEMGNRSDVQCRYHYKQIQMDSQHYGFNALGFQLPNVSNEIRPQNSYGYQMNSMMMMPPPTMYPQMNSFNQMNNMSTMNPMTQMNQLSPINSLTSMNTMNPMSLFAGKPMSASTPNLMNNIPKMKSKRGRKKKTVLNDVNRSHSLLSEANLKTSNSNDDYSHYTLNQQNKETIFQPQIEQKETQNHKDEKEQSNDAENDIFISFSDYVDW